MKKILLAGVICIIVGGLFCGAAYAMGEKYIDSNLTDISVSFSANDINKINIEEYLAEVNILKNKSSSGNIEVKAENIIESEYECSLYNNKLSISYNPHTVRFGFISLPRFYMTAKTPVINIYIPEGYCLDEIYFNSGVGQTYVEEIITDSLIISGGLGDFNIKNIVCESININNGVGRTIIHEAKTKSFVISGGLGDYDIKNIVSDNLNIDNGVGSVRIHGIINGDTKIDGGLGDIKISGELNGNISLKNGVGSANLDLSGDIDDYNIKVDTGVGSIKVNGGKIIDSMRNGGKYTLDIDGGLGDISINIK